MGNRLLKIFGYALSCILLIWALFASIISMQSHTARQRLTSVNVALVDSTHLGSFISRDYVVNEVERIVTAADSTAPASTFLLDIKQSLEQNGFIKSVSCHLTYDGELYIDVAQQTPIMRLLVDGYNSYITREGVIFKAPQHGSYYLPVITGSYAPLFAARFEGDLQGVLQSELEEVNLQIAAIEREKYPFYILQRELKNDWREYRKNAYVRARRFESREEFDERIEFKKASNAKKRRELQSRERSINAKIEAVDKKIRVKQQLLQRIERKYTDFSRLIEFVDFVNRDPFWSSEIAQIVALSAPNGVLRLKLVPRSGTFAIEFGEMEREEEKLAKLKHFYLEGLPKVGWDRYKEVNIEYIDQVVCR